jgi:CPA2 family monovalent cation:H+ antiporter-2
VRKIAIPGAIFQIAIASALEQSSRDVRVVMDSRNRLWDGDFGREHRRSHRVLADNRDLQTPSGHIAIGWLIVEDLFTILLLVLLPALFGATGIQAAEFG